jgi:hypothetical protein
MWKDKQDFIEQFYHEVFLARSRRRRRLGDGLVATITSNAGQSHCGQSK